MNKKKIIKKLINKLIIKHFLVIELIFKIL
jgi:hypothetical protein